MIPSGDNAEALRALREGARVGRADIVQFAIGTLRESPLNAQPETIPAIISSLTNEGDAATPLHSASAAGHVDVIRALLNSGAQVNVLPLLGPFEGKRAYDLCKTDQARDAFSLYFFEQIAKNEMTTCMNLLEGGMPATLEMRGTGESALGWACTFSHYDVARLLAERGADPNAQNEKGQTPLHIACGNGDSTIVSLLLQFGADETLLDSDGKLPLDLLDPKNDSIPLLIKNRPGIAKALPQASRSRTSSYDVTKRPKTEDELEYAPDDDEQHPMAAVDAPVLVLWPPVQVQRRRLRRQLVLTGEQPTYICIPSVDIDMFPLLTWSGLVDILDKSGLSVQVKRSAVDCAFRFSVNPRTCAGRHRYEISITSQAVFVQASDYTGLLYAAQTLTQVISLHCEAKVVKGQPQLSLPCIEIVDYPTIPDRGVLWSYRSFLRTASHGMRTAAQQLSRLRLNQLYLVLDSPDGGDGNGDSDESPDAPDPQTYYTNGTHRTAPSTGDKTSDVNAAAKLCAIDEVSRRHNIEVVPTLFVHRREEGRDYFPTDLMRNLSGRHACIVLALARNTPLATARAACGEALQAAAACGTTSVMLVPNTWTAANVDVLSIAHGLGLDASVQRWSAFVPSNLLTRPLCCVQGLVVDLKMRASAVARSGHACSVVPAMMDVFFSQPMLMVKYTAFLHAGFSWNSRGVTDMLGRRADVSILRECISLMLLDGQGVGSQDSDARFSTLLELFTGPVPPPSDGGPAADGVLHPPLDVAAEEGALVALVSCSSGGAEHTIAPSKTSLAVLLRHYKRILVATQWKCQPLPVDMRSQDQAAAQEMHEYLMALHLMAVVCRALVLGYNSPSLPSGRKKFTVGELLSGLQTGTKTDVANALLEAIDAAVDCWRGRFDRFSHALLRTKTSTSEGNDTLRRDGEGVIDDGCVLARAAQLRQARPEIPGLALLHLIGENIPEVFLEQITEKLSAEQA